MQQQIENEATIKSLNTRLCKERAALKVLEIEISNLNNRKSAICNNIKNLKDRIEKINSSALIMSEHAILRYIERVEIISIEEVKNKVLSEELIKVWKILGNGTYPLWNSGYSAVIRNNVITTIKKND